MAALTFDLEFSMKNVFMTIRIEADLRERFMAAVGREHRSAAQVLRDFMRAYIEKTETPPDFAEEASAARSDT
jgi:predicted DNA-binding protein